MVGGVDQEPRRTEIAALAGNEWISVHPVHVDRHAIGPSVTEFRHRNTDVNQQRPLRPSPALASFWAGITPIEKLA